MNRENALKLLHDNMQNVNLRRHCYAVEAAMRGLARYFKEDEDIWGIAGLLHDVDYEVTKENDPRKNHTKLALEWLKNLDAHMDLYDAIAAHAWGYVEGAPEPKTKMQWSLYCCDELTGLIVAVALVKPEKKLASVTVDSVMNKWGNVGFARGVERGQIERCEDTLSIPLREFIQIVLTSMQTISGDLGL